MQPNEQRSTRSELMAPPSESETGISPRNGDGDVVPEFAEPIPEYLRLGYRALMTGDASTAIKLWESLYERYPSAEVCGHIARAHYYKTFFLGHGLDHPQHAEHILKMRLWAERALSLNPNSSIGHAMLAAAIGRLSQLSGSQRQIISTSWQVRQHAEQAIMVDNTWVGHFVLGLWHREIASVHPGLRALAGLLRAHIPEGSYLESIRHFEEVLRQYPENNTLYAEIAYTYEKMGDMKKTKEMLERCITMPLFRHPIAPHLTEIAARRYREKFNGARGTAQAA